MRKAGNKRRRRRFLYDGATIIGEYDDEEELLRRYVHGPAIDEPIVWYEGEDTSDRRWLAADQLGSVIAITDGAGDALDINSYGEYGIPGTANAGRFQYTGQAWLPEVALYHYKARAYSPTLGRFMQTDPILFGALPLGAYTYTSLSGYVVAPLPVGAGVSYNSTIFTDRETGDVTYTVGWGVSFGVSNNRGMSPTSGEGMLRRFGTGGAAASVTWGYAPEPSIGLAYAHGVGGFGAFDLGLTSSGFVMGVGFGAGGVITITGPLPNTVQVTCREE